MCMYAHNVETRIARARARVCVVYVCMYVRMYVCIYVCVYVSTLYCRISAWRHFKYLPWKPEENVCMYIILL
jgi:hypothetical protein